MARAHRRDREAPGEAPQATGAPSRDEPLQAALVALDPRDRRGARDGRRPRLRQSHFNRATQAKRQPGSAFKPFVYAAALERGYSPGDADHQPRRADHDARRARGCPRTSTRRATSMTMRAALRTSSNRAAVRMLEEVGIPATVRYAKRLGVGSVPSVPSLALGSGEVTLLVDDVRPTRAFANAGHGADADARSAASRRRTARCCSRRRRQPQRAVSEATAFLMSTMLADVINAGHGVAGARSVGFTLPAAGKTGTTNDYHDAWFVGYTPKLVTGVWVGYDQPRTIIGSGYAAVLAVPMWGRFMTAATRKDQARVVQRAGDGHVGEHLPPERQAARPTRCRDARGRSTSDGDASSAVDGLHRVLRARHGTDRVVPDPPAGHHVAARAALATSGLAVARRAAGSRMPVAAAAAGARRRRQHRGAANGRPRTPQPEQPQQARLLVAGLRPRRRREADVEAAANFRARHGSPSRLELRALDIAVQCSARSSATAVCCRCCRARSRATRCRRRCCWPVRRASASVATAVALAAGAQLPRAVASTQATRLERDACGECASCRRIARGVHPDVIVIEPGDTGTIKIEQVRDVDRSRRLSGRSKARRRVVIIDEADALVRAGAERAAEDARGAAVGVDLRARVVDAGRAAADRAVALPAAAVRRRCRRRRWPRR